MAVRRESVVLSLDDRFSTGMAIAAAKTEMLRRELDKLDGSGTRGSRGVDRTTKSTDDLNRSTTRGRSTIDQFSGRLRVLADVAAIVGPALGPIASVGIPAVTGLAAQFGFAALAGGVMIGSFQGVGDALKAMNKAGLEPTEANLQAARDAMAQIGPDAQNLVEELRALGPALRDLRDTGAAGFFPGLTAGIDELESRLPDVQRIVGAVAGELGDIAESSGASLASARWDDFFTFLATDAPPALASLARAVGNTTHALAELWMAFDPLNDDFSVWLEDATHRLDEWASSLSQTQGFSDFIAYVRETGPQVADTFAAIGNAILQIVQASAPLGGAVLQGLEGVARVVAAIADSDMGPSILAAATALAVLSRSQALFGRIAATSWMTAVRGADTFGAKMTAARPALLKGGAAMAGLALASSDVAQKFDLSHTASLALLGTLGGPWGAAVGGAVGLVLDLGSSNSKVSTDVNGLTQTLNQQTGAITANTRAFTAGELEKQGVLTAAKALGLSLSDVTSAALGNSDALTRVNDGLSSAKDGFYNADGTIRVGAETLRAYGDNMHLVRNAIGGSNAALTEGQGRIARMSDAAAQSAPNFKRMSAQLIASREAARATARSFITLGDSLNDAKVGLNGWIRQMARQADALANFANNAQRAANKGLRHGLIAALQKMGPEGALRMRQLANASEREIGRANAAWARGRRVANLYADAIGGGATQAQAKIALMRMEIARVKSKMVHMDEKGAAAARARIQALKRAIDALHDKSVTITHNVHTNTYSTGSGNKFKADGGTVEGERQPYRDKVPTILAPGEEVISNRHGQADRHRDLLKAINANRLADGGTATVRARAAASIGGTASTVAYDAGMADQIAALTRQVAQLHKELATHPERTAAGVTRGVNGAAATAVRRQR